MITGEKICLSEVLRRDIEKLREWYNSPEWKATEREYRIIGEIHQERWFESLTDARNQVVFSVVEAKQTELPKGVIEGERKKYAGKLVGFTGVTHINWVYRTGEVDIMIDPEQRGLGYGIEAVEMILDHAFLTLNLNMMFAEVYELNDASRKLFKKVGFQEDGRRRAIYYWDGKYQDSILFSMLKNEWLAIKKDGG